VELFNIIIIGRFEKTACMGITAMWTVVFHGDKVVTGRTRKRTGNFI
jgi:hypothetical protein